MEARQLRTLIAKALEERGPFVSKEGRATRLLIDAAKEMFPEEHKKLVLTSVSSTLRVMDDEGEIVRDQPNLRSVTRIEKNAPGVRPAIKHPQIIMERAGRVIADEMAQQYDVLLDQIHQLENELAQRSVPAPAPTPTVSPEKERLLKHKLEAAEERVARLQANVEGYEKQIEELQEKLVITEHNLEVWKRNATSRPVVREMLQSVESGLDPRARRELRKLMESLPTGR